MPGALPAASPLVLEFPCEGSGATVYVGCDGLPCTERPGNGGCRVWDYASPEAAIAECIGLSRGMTAKHAAYNTGFSGAKLVVDASEAAGGARGLDKTALMATVADALEGLGGGVYTGCDLNTDDADMAELSAQTPYVLAGLGSRVDTNVATGHGVFGALQGAFAARGEGVRGKRFFVHGSGKVGSTVASLLAKAGAEVLTFDAVPAAADVPGCRNVSSVGDWPVLAAGCDALVPCSISGLLDEGLVETLLSPPPGKEEGEGEGPDQESPGRLSLVLGASNLPFADESALSTLLAGGVDFVPESVSSAGAILVDSIECFDNEGYRSRHPEVIYAYVRHLTFQKTAAVLRAAGGDPRQIASRVRAFSAEAARDPPAGEGFSAWAEANTEKCDYLVVGGGVAGTAAALELARAAATEGSGARTVLLEAREVATAEGSSNGDSRMYRRMYSQEYFSEMQRRALELWSELESALPPGEGPLLREHGLLFYGDTDTGETVEGSVPGARATMERLGLEHEWLEGPEALEARWGSTAGMRCRPGDAGVFEPGAGSIRASDACRAMAGLASAAGASVIEGEAAVSVSRTGVEGEVEVVTSQGRVFRTPRLVLAAGAWTNEVLKPLGAEFELEVHRVHWGHYRVAAGREAAAGMPQWFCFRKSEGRDGGLYYGFPPEHDCPAGDLVKVGVDFTPREPGHVGTSMDGFQRGADPGVGEMMDAFLAEHWAGAELERVDLQCSPYTMTCDGAFVLDRLPGCPEVVVFTGGSGRAFKFGPLLGRLMAELARGDEPSYDLGPLSALREGVLRRPADAAGGAEAPASPPEQAPAGNKSARVAR